MKYKDLGIEYPLEIKVGTPTRFDVINSNSPSTINNLIILVV